MRHKCHERWLNFHFKRLWLEVKPFIYVKIFNPLSKFVKGYFQYLWTCIYNLKIPFISYVFCANYNYFDLGLLWQIIRIGLFNQISLEQCPGLANLLQVRLTKDYFDIKINLKCIIITVIVRQNFMIM